MLQNNKDEQEPESNHQKVEESSTDVKEVTVDSENNIEIKKENDETHELDTKNDDEKAEDNDKEKEANEKKEECNKTEEFNETEENNETEEANETQKANKTEDIDEKEEKSDYKGEANQINEGNNKKEEDNQKDEEVVGELLTFSEHNDTNTNEIVDRLQQELEQDEDKSKEHQHEKDVDYESKIDNIHDTTEEQLSGNRNMHYAEDNAKINEDIGNVSNESDDENLTEENEEIRHMKDNSNHDNEGIVKYNNVIDHPNHEEHDLSDTENKDHKFLASIEKTHEVAEDDATTNEGNTNGEHNEDDDDVQVQGEANSEYSDSNSKSTAELSDLESAKRGKAEISSGAIHETNRIKSS